MRFIFLILVPMVSGVLSSVFGISFFDNTLNYLDQIKFAYKISSITATNPKTFNVIINKIYEYNTDCHKKHTARYTLPVSLAMQTFALPQSDTTISTAASHVFSIASLIDGHTPYSIFVVFKGLTTEELFIIFFPNFYCFITFSSDHSQTTSIKFDIEY